MTRFTIQGTPLPHVKIVERHSIADLRGYLVRLFCAEELTEAGWQTPVAQINYTLTRKKGTVRGMHYQMPPNMEMKLINCLKGKIWDVAVDLREGSSTFLRWHGEELSENNCKGMLIPEGYAHGFQTLTDNVELLYLHSTNHAPRTESGVNPKDPNLSIVWPLAISELSVQDADRALLGSDFQGIKL